MHIIRKLIFVLFIFSSFLINASETEIYEFGNNTQYAVIFTSCKDINGNDTKTIKELREFINFLNLNPPEYKIIISFTANDLSILQKKINIKQHQGTLELLQYINAYKSTAVFIFEDSNKKNNIIPGARHQTSPSWMIIDLYNATYQHSHSIDFNLFSIYKHRLHLTKSTDTIDEYFNHNIPGIILKSNTNIIPICKTLMTSYNNGIPQEWDRHFLILPIGKNIFTLNEKTSVLIISILLILSLFNLFMFTFKHNKIITPKDTIKIIILILSFFINNILILLISKYMVFLLFFIKFGNYNSINLFPAQAIISYMIFYLLLSIISLKYISKKMSSINLYLYNNTIHIITLLNILIFSAFEFSLYPIFIIIYFMTIIYSKFKNTILQIIMLACMLYPIFILIPILDFKIDIIKEFLFNDNTIYIALLILPFSFAFPKFILSKKEKAQKVYTLKYVLCFILFIFLIPWCIILFTNKKNIPITIYQTINDKTIDNKIVSDVKTKYPKDLLITSNENNINDYITANIKINNHLERSLWQMIITSPLKIEALNITIYNQDGFPVYEADKNMSRISEHTSLYTSYPRPSIPFELNFSSEKNAKLYITVTAWSTDNPLKTKLNQKYNIFTEKSFLLEITKKFIMIGNSKDEQ